MYRSVYFLALCVLFVHEVICQSNKDTQKDCAAEIGYNRKVDPLMYMDSDGKFHRNFKCYITCKNIVSHILKENGRLRTKLIIKILPSNVPNREKAVADIRNCNRQSSYLGSTDKCDVGFSIAVCLARKDLAKIIENVTKNLQ